MSEFIELAGASGRRYRFHRIAGPEALPAIAGNFVHGRTEGAALEVVCVGAAQSLTAASKSWTQARQSRQADVIFIRRNVSRRIREEEHRDLVEGLDPPMQVMEEE